MADFRLWPALRSVRVLMKHSDIVKLIIHHLDATPPPPFLSGVWKRERISFRDVYPLQFKANFKSLENKSWLQLHNKKSSTVRY